MSNKPKKMNIPMQKISKMKKKRRLNAVAKDIKTVASTPGSLIERTPRPLSSAESAAVKRLTKDALRVTVGSDASNVILAALNKPYKPTKVNRVNLNKVSGKNK